MRTLWGLVVVLLVLGGGYIIYRSFGNNTSSLNTAVDRAQELVPTVSEQIENVNTQTVEIGANGYSPSSVTIKKGTKVTWKNEGSKMANVSSDPHPQHTSYAPLNLGNIQDQKSASLVFNETGTFNYHNHLQPSQKGSIIVQ
ncbi:MAG: cupredoxin domain-containing protein [Candidatus Blackburnbacteria bacterium]|nr:cupredoxin domain-containing protein [Candidatus Blackburnbacteria bacterium]